MAGFKCLAQELQDLIWSFTLSQSTITFRMAKIAATTNKEKNEINVQHGLTYDEVEPLRVCDDEEGAGWVWDGPGDFQTPVAFSICQASRNVALSKNYKVWKLYRFNGTERRVLWNPETDIVFIDAHCGAVLNSFIQNFCGQGIMEIQNLALPYEFWACYRTRTTIYEGDTVDTIDTFVGPMALMHFLYRPSNIHQLFVIVSKEFFDQEVHGNTGDALGFWTKDGGVSQNFHLGRLLMGRQWGEDSIITPRIGMAWNFEMIRKGEDFELPHCMPPEDWYETTVAEARARL